MPENPYPALPQMRILRAEYYPSCSDKLQEAQDKLHTDGTTQDQLNFLFLSAI